MAPNTDAVLTLLIATRLQELMARTGSSKSDLAFDLRVHYKQVHGWLNGNHQPSTAYVIALANYFGVTTDYLLGVSDDGRIQRD